MNSPKRGIDTTLGQAGYCAHCDSHMPTGVDACLGVLSGVSHACCGHGDVESAYVVIGGLPDQDANTIVNPKPTTLRGRDALDYFEAVR